MFSGIVAATGRIARAASNGDGLRVHVDCGELPMSGVGVGDSIAVQGVCLTVVALEARGFAADVSRATLSVTHGLAEGRSVNLEKALRVGDRLDGHLVAGHVDGVGTVVSVEAAGDDARAVFEAPRDLARFIARKGSITVDGVSLTVNSVEGARFEVNLIPHTRRTTTLGELAAGDRVNLEIDILARYVERALNMPKDP
jgi:riboflavin synthase